MATLSATITRSTTGSTVNLTSLGGDDYLVGRADNLVYNYKSGGTLIGTPSSTWDFTDANQTPSGYSVSGTDGDPTSSFTYTTLYGGFTSSGDTWTVTISGVSTATRTLKLFWSNGFANASVTATLSDGSVSPLEIFRDDGSGSGDYFMYDLEFAAGSSGQSLELKVTTLGPNCFIGWLWVSSEASSGITGTVAVTTADDTSSASGTTTVLGASSVTTLNDTSTASGTTTVIGSVSVTTGNDTSNASGSPVVYGSLSVTTGDDVATASGTVGGDITGTVNVTTGDDTSTASGTTTVLGVASSVTGDDTSNASGSTTVIGSASITTGDDVATASGNAGTPTGTANITTGNDICTAFGIVPQDNLFGGVAHFAKLSERSKKLRELEAQERIQAPTSEDIAEVVQIPQEVKEVISNVAKIDNDKKQRTQLKAQLKALEIQFKQEYADALKTEMIRQYLVIELERQEEEETIAMMMMALV